MEPVLQIKVRLMETDAVKNLLEIAGDALMDERIPPEVRTEYSERIGKEVIGNESEPREYEEVTS